MKAVVTGMIATYPVGGVVWDYGQYAVGLEKLGFEVYYLEDTGTYTYSPAEGEYGEDPSFGVDYLARSLNGLSPELGNRWHFRSMDGRSYGIPEHRFEEIVASSDLLLNVSGGTLLRDAYMRCPTKVLIDTDPGWNHFVNYPKWDQSPGWQGTRGYRAHDHFFTYAERIGKSDCLLPELGIQWKPTRPTVLLDQWDSVSGGDKWTTVMTWNNFRKPVEYEGRVFGTKEMEFGKIDALPGTFPKLTFELATGGSGVPEKDWKRKGWSVIDSHSASRTPDEYREYIQRSRGEFSVAKNLYVATRSGWFSCRSICYLAAGRPVVVQDTGFTDLIPTGEGIHAFSNLEEAIAGIETVEREYNRQSCFAREISREYFATDVVLKKMLREIGLG